MNNLRIACSIIILSFAGFAVAGEKSSEKPVPDARTMKKADVIYNEIMMTLSPEMKARVDSSRTSTGKNRLTAKVIDSVKQKEALKEKNERERKNYTENLPDDVQLQVENAIREMEQRQKERALEFKEMKRGKH